MASRTVQQNNEEPASKIVERAVEEAGNSSSQRPWKADVPPRCWPWTSRWLTATYKNHHFSYLLPSDQFLSVIATSVTSSDR